MQLCLSRYQFKRLRHCLTGGEPLNPEVLEQWKAQTGLELYEGYGQTEVVCLRDKVCVQVFPQWLWEIGSKTLDNTKILQSSCSLYEMGQDLHRI